MMHYQSYEHKPKPMAGRVHSTPGKQSVRRLGKKDGKGIHFRDLKEGRPTLESDKLTPHAIIRFVSYTILQIH